jgi:SSS family solute:Na+ symporter
VSDANEIFQQTNFTRLDWVIVVLYPLISVGIGIYVRKLIHNMSDFVVAGQGLGVWLGIATMTGTELGLITVMYNAQKGFTGAFAAIHIALAAGIVTLLVGITGFFVYRLREMRVLTIPEFYERRFDRRTRVLGGIMMALGGILNMGLFLQVGSKFIVGITGLSEASMALPIAMVVLISFVLFYTCLGGMISVVIADYVQFVVLSFGLLLATFLAVHHLGWTNIFVTVEKEVGVAGFDPTVPSGERPALQDGPGEQAGQNKEDPQDPEATGAAGGFGWEYIIWMGFLGLVSCAIWPTSVARALSMDSPKAVKRQYMLGSVSFMIRFLIPCFWGICALVFVLQDPALREQFFPAGFPAPESLPEGVTAKDNLYAMPIFLGRILPVGIIGIITAGMIAAFMSTHDSYLLCWSSVLTQDVVAPLYEKKGRKLGSKARITLTRVFIVVIGIYVLCWGLIYHGSDDIWDYMAVTGAIYYNGAFALLLGGLYWKRASSIGAFLALLAGIIAILGLGPVQHGCEVALNWMAGSSAQWLGFFDKLPGTELETVVEGGRSMTRLVFSIPPARVGLISMAGTTATMIIASLLFPDRKSQESPENKPEGDA